MGRWHPKSRGWSNSHSQEGFSLEVLLFTAPGLLCTIFLLNWLGSSGCLVLCSASLLAQKLSAASFIRYIPLPPALENKIKGPCHNFAHSVQSVFITHLAFLHWFHFSQGGLSQCDELVPVWAVSFHRHGGIRHMKEPQTPTYATAQGVKNRTALGLY